MLKKMVLACLVVAAVSGMVLVNAQRARVRKAADTASADKGKAASAAAGYQRYKVVRSMQSVPANPKVLAAANKDERLRSVMEVRGNKIFAKPGYAFAKLGNGKNVLTNKDNAAMPYMDVVQVKLDWGIVMWVCKCKGSTQPEDDSCKFEMKNQTSGGTCVGGACCEKTCIWIDDATGEVGVMKAPSPGD